MQLKHIVLAALSSVAFVHLPAQAAGLTQYQEKAVSNYATTQYPLVMAHGFGLGFSRIGTQMLGLDYWYQILPDLARNGATVLQRKCLRWNRRKFGVNSFYSKLMKSWPSPARKK